MPISKAKSKRAAKSSWIEPKQNQMIWGAVNLIRQQEPDTSLMSAEQLRNCLFSAIKTDPSSELRKIGDILVQENITGRVLKEILSFYHGNTWVAAKDVYYRPSTGISAFSVQMNPVGIIWSRTTNAIAVMADLIFIVSETSVEIESPEAGTTSSLQPLTASSLAFRSADQSSKVKMEMDTEPQGIQVNPRKRKAEEVADDVSGKPRQGSKKKTRRAGAIIQVKSSDEEEDWVKQESDESSDSDSED